ncbi:lipoprotein [Spiroplasma tabanidicola]|uniref:Lipoprotein n=1 Tax=Spiroplasma tabanidicola TaxID=324079 RepID=A0A6I6CB21_9MOLU|nr:lipoprotein [Spiroplasma tabanidicola]QGS52131.1 hypothetical protein STABA_v1c07750 [Spiroplasma tabanidicola]
MNKLLSFLGSFGMIATASNSVISCFGSSVSFGSGFKDSSVEVGKKITLDLKVDKPQKNAEIKAETSDGDIARVAPSISSDDAGNGIFSVDISGTDVGECDIKVTYGKSSASIKVKVIRLSAQYLDLATLKDDDLKIKPEMNYQTYAKKAILKKLSDITTNDIKEKQDIIFSDFEQATKDKEGKIVATANEEMSKLKGKTTFVLLFNEAQSAQVPDIKVTGDGVENNTLTIETNSDGIGQELYRTINIQVLNPAKNGYLQTYVLPAAYSFYIEVLELKQDESDSSKYTLRIKGKTLTDADDTPYFYLQYMAEEKTELQFFVKVVKTGSVK